MIKLGLQDVSNNDWLVNFSCFRRPVAVRVKDIGVWLQIMEALGRISVVANVNYATFIDTPY